MSTSLVNIQEQLKRELALLKGTVEAPGSNKISTRGKVFTLPNGKSSPGPIQAIVLDYTAVNAWYPNAYNAQQRVGPKCWAIGKIIDELEPSNEAEEQQNTDCKNCPKNQFGSAPTGKGKACKNQRKLMVVSPDFTMAEQPMVLFVSPTGLRGWNRYIERDLAGDQQVLPIQVITEIGFDPNQSYPSLTFKYGAKHGRLEEAMALRAKWQDILEHGFDEAA